MEVARSLLGMLVLLVLGALLSDNRRKIRPRVVVTALLSQTAIGALVLFVPLGRMLLSALASGVSQLLAYGNAGVSFIFGGLVGPKMFALFPDDGYIFGLRVLPIIIFVTSLISVLYYVGVMRWIVKVLGEVFHRLLGVSRLESFSAVTTLFVGVAEMSALVKPFIANMSGPELFAVMTSGLAAVSGSVLAGYVGLGVRIDYLIAASFMAIPGGLLFAKILCPSTGPSTVTFDEARFEDHRPANVIEAASVGAEVGLRIAMMIGAMLIAFIGLIALLNGVVGTIAGWMGYGNITLESLFGVAFAPLMFLLGVPWRDAAIAGGFVGQKLILNEFIAYAGLAPYLKDAASVVASGRQVLAPKTITIISFALCGFANFSSVGILTGCFSAVAPDRRGEVARYGLRVVAAATLSNLMSADIAGLFVSMT